MPYRSSPARRSTTIRYAAGLADTPATWSPTQGDDTPIEWIGRDERYHEKLATPDVTIADLIGEVDMIKHAEGRYLSSELTMHFGLIPRTNRGIFCINELPDLAPKIQVGLFNVLEERDVQIRGYPVRLDLDLCMVFSANPEDYTNRGRIVTPLKDRIGSVIRTHYPLTREIGIAISDQNAWLERAAATAPTLAIPHLHQGGRRGDRAAGPVVAARQPAVGRLGADVDRQPGERRLQRRAAGDHRAASAGSCRGSPTWPRPRASARGKLELTMSEDDGHEDKLIHRIIDEAVKNIFTLHLDVRELRPIVEYFESGQSVEVGDSLPTQGRARADRQGARPAEARRRAGRQGRPRPLRPRRPRGRRPPARPSSSSKGCTCTTSSTSPPRTAASRTGAER